MNGADQEAFGLVEDMTTDFGTTSLTNSLLDCSWSEWPHIGQTALNSFVPVG